jgi:hypothetical protein
MDWFALRVGVSFTVGDSIETKGFFTADFADDADSDRRFLSV